MHNWQTAIVYSYYSMENISKNDCSPELIDSFTAVCGVQFWSRFVLTNFYFLVLYGTLKSIYDTKRSSQNFTDTSNIDQFLFLTAHIIVNSQ